MGVEVARTVALLLAATATASQGPSSSAPGPRGEPRVIAARQADLERNRELRALIDQVHRDADAIVVLSSGNGDDAAPGAVPGLPPPRELLAMFEALATLAKERRIVVGDSGIRSGVMETAGKVRRASGRAFPLVGVAPAREIAPAGTTPVDANHSHIVAVDDPALSTGDSAWGTETATKYWLFDRFAEGRNSVAIVAGGGAATLNEVAANVEFGRPMILIEGSGGAADAMVRLARGMPPAGGEVYLLQQRARAARLARRPELFRIVPVDAGAAGLSQALRAELGPVLPRTR